MFFYILLLFGFSEIVCSMEQNDGWEKLENFRAYKRTLNMYQGDAKEYVLKYLSSFQPAKKGSVCSQLTNADRFTERLLSVDNDNLELKDRRKIKDISSFPHCYTVYIQGEFFRESNSDNKGTSSGTGFLIALSLL
ncbi:MAG: hypothetical protein ACTSXG_03180 [Alphaproteobacteria bacterium]